MLKVIKTGETKNMISFFEIKTGARICLMKSDFIKAVNQLKAWKENQYATFFSAMLFCLICKADSANRTKFLHGFPAEMTAYLLWYHSESEEKFFKEWTLSEIEE